MFGTIIRFVSPKRYGFILDEKGNQRFFHVTNVQNECVNNICTGAIVSFEPTSSPKGLNAVNIEVLEPKDTINFTRNRAEYIAEISEWKMEAKLEDNSRYFYNLDQIRLLESGKRCFVIGRKGTGKTAICEYLNRLDQQIIFSKKVSFKHFPFQELYDHDNGRFNFPNQYISIWKFIIYSEIAQLMMINQNINISIRNQLEEVYKKDIGETISNKVKRWTSSEFGINILGTGGTIGVTRELNQPSTSWLDRAEYLEKFIISNIDRAKYIIAFDELDEDYRNLGESAITPAYSSLLESLFGAIQDIKSRFPDNVLPVLFLRDDIFTQIIDSDRTKWLDLTINLDWSIQQIKNLLAFRLSRSWGIDEKIKPFELAWIELFSPEPFKNNSDKESLFNYISRFTQKRPRDYICFIRECARYAYEQKLPIVTPHVATNVSHKYSLYLRSEIEDEIRGLVPEIHEILDILSLLGRNTFKYNQFDDIYQNYALEMDLKPRNTRKLLATLFQFSVIGKNTHNDKVSYRYIDTHAVFEPNAIYTIHTGLLKSLHII